MYRLSFTFPCYFIYKAKINKYRVSSTTFRGYRILGSRACDPLNQIKFISKLIYCSEFYNEKRESK